jgi:hypothetical protein
MSVLLLVVIIILLFGGVPVTHARYGVGPSGLLGTVLIILLILMLLGRI